MPYGCQSHHTQGRSCWSLQCFSSQGWLPCGCSHLALRVTQLWYVFDLPHNSSHVPPASLPELPSAEPPKRSLAFRARAGAQLLGWLLLGKTPACGPVACQRVSCAANGGCGWKTVLEQYWLASHPLQCILYPAVLSSSRLAHNQPDLALPLSSFFSSFFGSLFFLRGERLFYFVFLL